MALVVFLRGVNVGGYRTFRPSTLAKELNDFGIVNIGAAGTFVVRKAVAQAKLRAEILRKLPFDAEVMICEGRDLIRIASTDPFVDAPAGPGFVRFVSVLARSTRPPLAFPVHFPPSGKWLLKVVKIQDRFLFGVYRREMKAISYLGQLDKLCGVPVTTRNWNTIQSIAKALVMD
jgi:uncharacterized protein (DUF1697 family)